MTTAPFRPVAPAPSGIDVVTAEVIRSASQEGRGSS